MTAELVFKPQKGTVSSLSARTLLRVADMLDENISQPMELIEVAKKGVPTKAYDVLIKIGYSGKDLNWVVNTRTLRNRKHSDNMRLSLSESDRWIRAAKIHALAAEVLGSDERAVRWLHRPRDIFQGQSAINLVSTEPGADLVEETLNKIDAGFFA